MTKPRRIHDGKIILKPTRMTDVLTAHEERAALDKLVRRQTKAGEFADYPSPSAARKYLLRPCA